MVFIELLGYPIKYDKNRALTIWRLTRSIPKILIRIKQENSWLRHLVAREELNLVISDNRYGLTTPGILCVFMTHQLMIKTPFGPWADRFLQTLNYRLIRRFSRCWVPDVEAPGLAGELSHPQRMPPIPTRYIGWLSRFSENSAGDGGDQAAAEVHDRATALSHDRTPAETPFLLVLLSGPEPQRTLLEKEILRQAIALETPPQRPLILVRGLPGSEGPATGDKPRPSDGGPPILVRGLPGGEGLPGSEGLPGGPLPHLPAWITVYNHLPAAALERIIRRSSLVVARSGYSTIMDLQRLGKRALVIPTPGQTEQEYLGQYLAVHGWARCVDQDSFSLRAAFDLAQTPGGERMTAPASQASPTPGEAAPTTTPAGQPETPGMLSSEIKTVLEMVKAQGTAGAAAG